jgi:RimJ/RimL family protein N-acetyltransferase
MDRVVFNGDIKGNHILVRYLNEEDAAILQEYINEASQEQTYILFQGEHITYEEELAYVRNFLAHVEAHRAVKLLAFHENTLIGVADLYLKERAEKHIGVFGITIHKNWRGKGLGSLLMDLTLAEGEKNLHGLKIITLGVFANNPIAKKMYEKKGFQKHGTLPAGLLYKGQFVDHEYMYKLAHINGAG